MKKILSLLIALALLASCTGGTKGQSGATDSLVADSVDFAFPVTFTHAEWVQVTNHPGYKELLILMPGSRDTLERYILYPRGRKPALETQAQLIPIPARTLGCLSTTDVGVLPILGLRDVLVACSEPSNINDSLLHQRFVSGQIANIGQGMGRNVEQILATHPDVLLQSMSESTEQDKELIRAGISTLTIHNWQEGSLLARAEWLKVVGLLFGRNQVADSAFRSIESEYRAACDLVRAEPEELPILYGLDYQGVWYIPSEDSYVTSMLRDAKLRYEATPSGVVSEPVGFEYVFSRHRHAKTWICVTPQRLTRLGEFLALSDRYGHFDAAQTGSVWVDRKTVGYGSSDFWEGAPYRPHLILKDLIKATRPHLLPQYSPTYFLRLER